MLDILRDSRKRIYLIRIFIVAFILFYNSASSMYIYSFLPQMMVDFGVAETATHSGKYASWMASGYFFGRFIASPAWGAFIDKSGRKSGLIIVLALISTLTLLFGLSQNFWWAFAIRIGTGFINGLSIIGKVMTTEVCPDDMKAWSISIISTLWSLGMTLGPFLGSFFYGWIGGWPYLASAIFISMFGYTLMILTWIYIEETLDSSKSSKPSLSTSPKKEVALKDQKDYVQIEADESLADEREEDYIADKKLSISTTVSRSAPDSIKTPMTDFQKEFGSMNRFQQFKYLLNIPNVLKLVFIFGINTFYAAVYGEMIPFWAAARYQDGGLGFKPEQISDLFVYLTGPQLLIQIFLYPVLQKKKGDFWLLTAGHWVHIPLFFLIPFAHLFPEGSMGQIMIYLIFWMFVRNLGSFMNFSALQRYTNDTISAEKRGQINGFQIAFSSLLQTLGPIIGGFVLSWSMTNEMPYPFNYHFTFLIMVAITFVTLYVIYSLDFADKEKKKLIGENGITTSD